jgi:hypothetical protein
MAAAISHEVKSSVVAVQLTRQYVIDVLRTAGLPPRQGRSERQPPAGTTLVRYNTLSRSRAARWTVSPSCRASSCTTGTTVVLDAAGPRRADRATAEARRLRRGGRRERELGSGRREGGAGCGRRGRRAAMAAGRQWLAFLLIGAMAQSAKG